MKNLLNQLYLAFLGAALCGCAVMTSFDQNSYTAANELKSESMALLAAGTEPAAAHQSDIDALRARLSAQLAYEQGKGKANTISAKQWEILISEEHDLLGKTLKDWEAAPLREPYLTEKRKQISDAFDTILNLEGAKHHDL